MGVSVGWFSHVCDKMPEKSPLRKAGWFDSGECIAMGRPGSKSTGHGVSAASEERRSAPFSPSVKNRLRRGAGEIVQQLKSLVTLQVPVFGPHYQHDGS